MKMDLPSLNKIISERFPDGVESLEKISQAELLRILLAREEYKGPTGDQGLRGIQGEKGDKGERGEKGDKGETGPAPVHEWLGTKLRFANPDGTFGEWVELKGEQGDTPEFQWDGSKIRFKNPNGKWGEWSDLKGEQGKQGEKGKDGTDGKAGKAGEKGARGEKGNPGDPGKDGKQGERGPVPKYEVSGKQIRFETPDGTFGPWLDLGGATVVYQTVTGSGGAGGPDNFSYRRIPELKVVTVPDAQQMIVATDDFIVSGELVLDGDGELFLLEAI